MHDYGFGDLNCLIVLDAKRFVYYVCFFGYWLGKREEWTSCT